MNLFQNIELKVEVESLKNELEEKQQLLDKALWVSESRLHQKTSGHVQQITQL